MDMGSILGILIRSVVLVVGLLTVFAYLMLFERKFHGWFQIRMGPTAPGPGGFCSPLLTRSR